MIFRMTPKDKIEDPETGKKVLNWWKETITLLSDTQITDKLVNFDKGTLDQPLIDSIKPFLEKDDFKPEALKSKSEVAMYLAKWIYAMEQVYTVNLVVKPLKEDLAKAEAEYEEVRKVLAVKEAALKKVEDEVAALQANLDKT